MGKEEAGCAEGCLKFLVVMFLTMLIPIATVVLLRLVELHAEELGLGWIVRR